MAGVRPIEIVTEEKANLYKTKHNAERSVHDCKIPLLIKEWPHSARRLNIMEISNLTPYCTETYRDGSKIGGKVRSRSGHISGPRAEKLCKYKYNKYI